MKRTLIVFALTLVACGDEDLLTTAPPPPPAPALAIVSGDNQQGSHNLPLPERFAVRVTNAAGQGVSGVRVTWAVTSGGGDLLAWLLGPLVTVTVTDVEGGTGVLFRPTVSGPSTSTISASAAGVQGSPVTFTARSDGYRIRIGPPFGLCDPLESPLFNPAEISVTVGTLVEWVASCDAHIVSTSVPPGGKPFDSGALSTGKSFSFIPSVAGEWTYTDGSGWRRGKLIVGPNPAAVPETGIFLASADGSNVSLLTAGSDPSWSPDGKSLLFVENREIQRVDADGTHRISFGQGGEPAWAPDGRRIVFVNDEGIAVMNADGSGVRSLVSHHFRTDTYAPWDLGVGNPAWSPDGNSIAFQHLGDGDTKPAQIFVMNADGSGVRRLTPTSGNQYAESDPAWSPDGSRIVFWSYGHGLANVPASGGVPQTLYYNFPTVAYGTKPAWSPDGRTIAFTANLYLGRPAIWSIASDGGPPSVLIPDGYDAAWSPDGGRIAFGRTRGL